MAINLTAITEDENKANAFFDWVLQQAGEPMKDLGTDPGGTVLQRGMELTDGVTGAALGKLIYTLRAQPEDGNEEARPAVIDVDMTLDNPDHVDVQLLQEFGRFVAWNKNYVAEVCDGDQRFVAEAAGRFIPGEKLEGKRLPVRLSAFPWTFDIFASLKAMNGALGFGYEEEAEVVAEGHPFGGLSERFSMPCVESEESHYSTIVGRIAGIRPAQLTAGDTVIDFTIVDLDTGLGRIPAAVNDGTFDLTALKEGNYVIMNASVAAEMPKRMRL